MLFPLDSELLSATEKEEGLAMKGTLCPVSSVVVEQVRYGSSGLVRYSSESFHFVVQHLQDCPLNSDVLCDQIVHLEDSHELVHQLF